MIGITQRQGELLQFLRAHFESHGFCPTYNEIRIALGFVSAANIHRLLRVLVERGYITLRPFSPRGIKLVQPEGHNTGHCFCDWCMAVRIRTAQTLIQALHVPAKILAGTNFKALGHLDRVCWLTGFPKPAHPETRKPKAKMQPANVGIA